MLIKRIKKFIISDRKDLLPFSFPINFIKIKRIAAKIIITFITLNQAVRMAGKKCLMHFIYPTLAVVPFSFYVNAKTMR